ncbi:MAG: fused MFS/spermidine synthase [Thermoguttaceae bacterium]
MRTASSQAAGARLTIVALAATILLGAFLLFQVQPVVSKAILPWYGGSPAVWTTCMLFFQVLLFGGYVYAHLLQRWLRPTRQALVHLAVVLGAMLLLPILPGPQWKPADASHPTWQILVLLAGSVGLPYFALAATSPLAQAWFSHALPGRSPYRLYALSNFGSLAALLSYPFLFEPALDLTGQSAAWAAAFIAYAVCCAGSLICVWRFGPRGLGTEVPSEAVAERSGSGVRPLGTEVPSPRVDADPPTGWDRFRWLALPALGSLMLLATTNHVCQDVAVVPFLWVIPLAIYLLSFIICFDHSRWYIRRLWAAAAVVALVGAAGNDILLALDTRLTLATVLTIYLGALFFTCMVCHGELVRLKPSPRYLTEFYLLIAAGGALGGLFVGVVAPHVFNTYLEWPVGMAISGVLAFALVIAPSRRSSGASAHLPMRLARHSLRLLCFGALAIAVGLALVHLGTWSGLFYPPLDRARNFFGVVSVRENDVGDPAMHHRVLVNGRIKHGVQFVDATKRRWPTSYYGPESGVGRAIAYLQHSGPIRFGAIGLGTGSLAVYARPGDTFRFYEINPKVLELARNRFTYLADCRGRCDVVLGDARLSLESEPPQRFGLLVVDAFSGDAIPTHLLTREAMAVYRRHLIPNGVIAIHVSNQYLRLAPVVRRLAWDCGMRCSEIYEKCTEAEENTRLLCSNDWVLVTRDDALLKAIPSQGSSSNEPDAAGPLWTDQYSNLFQILNR